MIIDFIKALIRWFLEAIDHPATVQREWASSSKSRFVSCTVLPHGGLGGGFECNQSKLQLKL